MMKKILLKTDQNHPAIRAYVDAVEKGKKDLHVFPMENGWIVKQLLSDKISKTFHTQQEALQYAETHAIQGTAVFIHVAIPSVKSLLLLNSPKRIVAQCVNSCSSSTASRACFNHNSLYPGE